MLVALVAAGVVLATGAVDRSGAAEQTRLLLPVVAFLAAILVVAEVCAAEGVFAAVGSAVARAGRRRPRPDAGADLRRGRGDHSGAEPGRHRGAAHPGGRLGRDRHDGQPAADGLRVRPAGELRVAAAAGLQPDQPARAAVAAGLSFAGFALLMAPVWLAVIAVEYVGHRLFFARDLARHAPSDGPRAPDVPLPVVPLVRGGADARRVRRALAARGRSRRGSRRAAAVALSGHALSRRLDAHPRGRPRHPPVLRGVRALPRRRGGGALRHVPRRPGAIASSRARPGSCSLLVVALVATVLANLVNNLPATLLLVPLVAPLGVTAVLAALVGLGVGSGLTYTGSLANLLWRRTLLRRGGHPPPRATSTCSAALVTLPAVVLGVVVLWAWAPLVG